MASVNPGSIVFELSRLNARTRVWSILHLAERLTAFALLVLTFPVLLMASIIIVAISRRSPLVAHQRVGRSGRLIWILKLRSMWQGDLPTPLALVHRLPCDEPPCLAPDRKNARVTNRFAAFCRRYSIDELPQLWQVVRGELALVGPRPLTRLELDKYYGIYASTVLSAKPGLSGLWQISGRSRLTYLQRRRLDLFLVRKWSIPLYFRILLITLPRVLAGKDAK